MRARRAAPPSSFSSNLRSREMNRAASCFTPSVVCVMSGLKSRPLDQERAADVDASEQTMEQMRAFASLGTRLTTSTRAGTLAYAARRRRAVRYVAVSSQPGPRSLEKAGREHRPSSEPPPYTNERAKSAAFSSRNNVGAYPARSPCGNVHPASGAESSNATWGGIIIMEPCV